jgi:hypothetical protein
MKRDPENATWMSDAQRRLLLALLGGAAATGLVGWLMPPSDAVYWVVLALATLGGIGLGWIGGASAPGRNLDRALLGRFGAPAPAWLPSHLAALEAEARGALERAVVPVLLGLLTQATRQNPVAEGLLATARDIMRQQQPPAQEVRLLATWLPPILEAFERSYRGVAEACTLLQTALRNGKDAETAARLEVLLGAPAPRKGQPS